MLRIEDSSQIETAQEMKNLRAEKDDMMADSEWMLERRIMVEALEEPRAARHGTKKVVQKGKSRS